MALRLFSAWTSSASYRVRLGLELKGLSYDVAPVDLAAGEQHKASFRAVNLQRLTPVLETDFGRLTQSLAILEWLEEVHPEPPLLPADPFERARARGMAALIASDIHPLRTARVRRALNAMRVGAAEQKVWIARWVCDGLSALEPVVAAASEGWCVGDRPGLVECCLIPEVYAARAADVDLTPFPALLAVVERAERLPAFERAHPLRQPGAG
jgi:maleylacetoacetate isomerase/maleylpyruvate isomerase